MSVLFIALPVALALGGAAVVAFVMAARSGQFDDLETPPLRMLFDDREGSTNESKLTGEECSKRKSLQFHDPHFGTGKDFHTST